MYKIIGVKCYFIITIWAIYQLISLYMRSKSESVSFIFFVTVNDHRGKEVILHYQTDKVKNEKTFWTDSNGRQMMKRILNFQPDFKSTAHTREPVSSNYYPVTSGKMEHIFNK